MRPFPSYPLCPVCGDSADNPLALGVRWFWDEERGEVAGSFTAGRNHTGYSGLLHGGLLGSLLDECLAWACAVGRSTYFVTGELTVRYRSVAPLGRPIAVTGRVVVARGPYVRAEGSARLDDGALVATAVGSFAAMPREQALRLRQALVFAPGAIDVLSEV
jgi:acyl-coenzyme A thioesterase PaaI-like protein